MNMNLNNIAEELFGKIRTQFPSIDLKDEAGDPISADDDNTIGNARSFDFDYEKNGINLGNITVNISEKEGMVILYSNGIVDNARPGTKKQWFNFLRELREFSLQRMMKFNTRDITKSNLDKRDHKILAKTNGDGSMTESKLWGTSKTSFQEMGEAKLIVRHSKPVNYNLPAGRTLHIESIYVENADGERFKYPYKHLNGARALATHVAHGGNSYDNIGQHIIGLSEELNKLRMFKGYVNRNPIVSEAMGAINDKVFERIDQVKKEIHSLQNPNYYKTFAESFTNNEEQVIPEDVVNDWIDRLTIRSFNEELKNVFPYIYKLVGEEISPVVELTPQDLLTTLDIPTPESFEAEIAEINDYEAYINDLVKEADEEVAEEKEDPPFDGPYKKPGDNKDQFGNVVKNPARHAAKKGMAAAIAKAKKAGATAETVVNFGFGEMSLGEAIGKAGMDVEEFFESNGKQNEIVEFIKSMYDDTTGAFPKGETGVLIAVEKEFGDQTRPMAEKVISELSQIYESKRLRQLAGLA